MAIKVDKLPNFSLIWEGWKTDIYTLNSHGWVVYTDECFYDLTMVIALKNDRLRTVALSNKLSLEFMRTYNRNPDHTRGMRFEGHDHFPTLNINYMNFKSQINIMSTLTGDMVHLQPRTSVDLIQHHSVPLETYFPDNSNVDNSQKIIIPEYSIPELLTMIKDKQKPLQREILEKQNRNVPPQEKVAAKIIAIA